MGWDLDEILNAACVDRAKPVLVEVARSTSGRDATTAYFWSTGRISASVSGGRVRLKRRLGIVGSGRSANGLDLDVDELRALAIAASDWKRRRKAWAAFYFSCGGYPPGYGGASWYQPRGPSSQRVKIGESVMGNRTGADLVGRDQVVAIQPRPLGARVRVIEELWRRGEVHGPAEGSLVGLRYELGATARLDAKREGAKVWRSGGAHVYLEPSEDTFVAALLEAVRTARGRKRP